MTTKNVDGIAAAASAAMRTAESVRRRHSNLEAEVRTAEEERRSIAEGFEIARKAADQQKVDELNDFYEELGQLNNIMGINSAEPEAREPAQSEPEPQPEPETEPEPEEAPEPETDEYEDSEESAVVQPVVVHRSIFEVREWSGLQWLLAVAGALVALMVFSMWPGWASRNIESGFWSALVNVLFFIGHLGIGFFGGGWLGWHMRRNQNDGS